jgi:hypothetical protein
MSEKSVLSSLSEEGWEFVRVVPFSDKPNEEIDHDGTKLIKGFWVGLAKKTGRFR